MTMEISKKKTQICWLLKRLVLLSFLMEKVQFQKQTYILIFIALQRIFAFLLPTLLLPDSNGSFTIITNVALAILGRQTQLTEITVQIIIMILWIIPFFFMIGSQQNRNMKKGVLFCILDYCFSPIMLIMSSQCLIKNNIPFEVKILSTLNLIVGLFLIALFNLLTVSYNPVSSNHTCVRLSKIYIFHELCQKIGCIFAPLIVYYNNKLTILLFIFTIFFCSCVSMYKILKSFIFINPRAAKINRFFICLEFSIAFTTLVCRISNESILLSNYWIFMPVFNTFAYSTMERLLSFRNQSISLAEEEQLSINNVIQYVWNLNRLSIHRGENKDREQLMLHSLKKKHEKQCSRPDCYCRRDDEAMIKSLLLQIMYGVELKMSNYFDLVLFNCYSRLAIKNVYADSLYRLNAVSKGENSWLRQCYLQFWISKFKLSLNEFLQEKTRQMASTEKIIESEDYCTEIMKNWSQLIQLKVVFWAELKKQAVNRETFLKNTEQQLEIMKKLNKINDTILNSYKSSYVLLTLLLTYEKYILLKSKLPNILNERFKNMRRKFTMQIFHKKGVEQSSEVQNFILGEKCCCFQSSIEDRQMGKILRASKNVKNIFGYDPDRIQGLNINQIMPASMRIEHDAILQNWLRRGTWENVGKMRNIFGLTKQDVCFSMSIYLKILQRENSINIIAAIFIKNTSDHMIINKAGIIDGAGTNFLALLGKNIVGLPLSILQVNKMHTQQTISEKSFPESKNGTAKKANIFLSTQQLNHEIEEYHKLNFNTLDKSLSEQKLSKIREDLRVLSKRHEILFEQSVFKMGKISFTLLTMIRSSKNEEQWERDQNMNTSICEQQQQLSIQLQNERQRLIYCENNSYCSSRGVQNYSIDTTINIYEDVFLNRKKIKQRKTTNVIISVILLSAALLIASMIKAKLFSAGFKQIIQILEVDFICSNSMQLAEFQFNKAMNLNLYYNRPQYSSIKASTLFQKHYIDNLLTKQIRNMLQKTSLTHTNLYSYLETEMQWKISQNQSVRVSIINFFVNFIHLTEYFLSVKVGTNVTVTERYQILRKMAYNFPNLKKINHEKLQFFNGMLTNNISYLTTVGAIKILIAFLIMATIFLIIHFHYEHRLRQVDQIWYEYGHISLNNCSAMLQYYKFLQQFFQKKEKYIYETDVDNQIMEFDENILLDSIANSKKVYNNFQITQRPLRKWILVFACILVFFSSVNACAYIQEKSFLDACTSIIFNMNKLINSQNVLIESYFSLKYNSAFNVTNSRKKELRKQSLDLINRKTTFSEQAISIIGTFEIFDADYNEKMIFLLTDNVCEMLEKDLPVFLIKKCENQLKLRILENGLINGMNFLQEIVIDAFYMREQGQFIDFTSITFINVDFSFFYMFKVYEAIENQIVFSMTKAYNSRENIKLAVVVLEGLFSLFCFVFCFIFYQREKRILKDRFGMMFLVPAKIVKSTKYMINSFEKIIEVQ